MLIYKAVVLHWIAITQHFRYQSSVNYSESDGKSRFLPEDPFFLRSLQLNLNLVFSRTEDLFLISPQKSKKFVDRQEGCKKVRFFLAKSKGDKKG